MRCGHYCCIFVRRRRQRIINRVSRRAKSILKRVLLAICLLLTAAVVTFWIRSYTIAERYIWLGLQDNGSNINLHDGGILGGKGGMSFFTDSFDSVAPSWRERLKRFYESNKASNNGYSRNPSPRYPMPAGVSDETFLGSLGFCFYNSHQVNSEVAQGHLFITFPFWSLFVLTAAYPVGLYVAGVVRRQREDRIALGLCPRCGVPLNEDSDRCPGCDKPVPALRQT